MRQRSQNLALLGLCFLALAACSFYLFSLPDVTPLKKHIPATTAYIEEARARAKKLGQPFNQQMIWVSLNHISENLRHAVFIAEDDMFYRHHGIDWDATWHAFKKDWRAKRLVSGGSTITQQTARNLYLSPSKNPLRKLKEMLIARELEKKLSKRRIMELYLNIAEWGKGIYGAEAASLAYFNKHASEITPEEAAALAAVLPSPRRHNPAAQNSGYVARNKERILTRMRASGLLPEETDEAQAQAAYDILIETSPAANPAWDQPTILAPEPISGP